MKVRFHKTLYSKTAIDAAVAAFSDDADFSTSRVAKHVVVDIQPKGPAEDANEVIGEFLNYVLGGTIAERGTP